MIASGSTVSISTSVNGTILQAIAYKSGMSNSPVHRDVYYSQGGGQQMMGGGMAMSMAMPPSRSESFVYDQLGNRKGVNVLDGRGNVTFARRDTGLNQYTSWTPPMAATNYDTNGVLTSEGGITGTYNALNQPVTISSSASSISFGYDPLGRCVKRVTSGTGAGTLFLYYDGWNLIQEGSSATSVNRIYVHGNRVDEIVADQAGGIWNYHHYDARGHCILLTDASGNLVEQYSYDAFGKVYYYDGAGNTLTDTARGNRFLFTGREWLSTLRLYDFRNRHYLPELGRFIQPDPIQFKAGDYNLYRYCHNDPINKSDPLGLYGMGIGWTNKEWASFSEVQKKAIAAIQSTLQNGMGKENFEKHFGQGSATKENIAKVTGVLNSMLSALQDNGQNGHFANAVTSSYMKSVGRPTAAGASYRNDRNSIYIATDNPSFANETSLARATVHESGHNSGLEDKSGYNGKTAYARSGNNAELNAFRGLPYHDQKAALQNADTYTNFIFP